MASKTSLCGLTKRSQNGGLRSPVENDRPPSCQGALDAGDSAAFQAFLWLQVFSASKQSPRPPQRHAPRTQTVRRSKAENRPLTTHQ